MLIKPNASKEQKFLTQMSQMSMLILIPISSVSWGLEHTTKSTRVPSPGESQLISS